MAISLTCSSCDRAFKVKDELAGRKIKCPGCGAPILVQTEEEALAAKNRAAREPDEDEEDRPKKKKKKKKKANSNLGLIVGAGAGLVVIVAIILFLVMNRGPAKEPVAHKKVEPPSPVQQEPEKKEPSPIEKKQPAGAIARIREGPEVSNVLKQLGIAERNCEGLNGKGPKDQKELLSYLENNILFKEYLTKGWITFIYGTTPNSFPDGRSNTILAYEPEPDRQNIRYVLMADGSVQTLDEATFRQTPKAKGK